MLIAIGLAVGFRAMSGTSARAVHRRRDRRGRLALHFDASASPLLLPAMVVAGAIGGALWASIPAFLRIRFNANEILVSLMLVYIAQLMVSWLVHGPWKDPQGFNFPQTKMFSDAALLPTLVEGARLNAVLPLALAAVLAAYVFMQKSFLGFQMRVAGESDAAARYAGYSTRRTIWTGMLAGGAMAASPAWGGRRPDGSADRARIEQLWVRGDHRRIRRTLASRRHSFREPADGASTWAASRRSECLNLPSSIAKVFQGMLLLFLLGTDVFVNYRLRWSGDPKGRSSTRSILTSILAATLVAGTPLILAALGELVTERSGVLNLGTEGLMSIGAVAGFAARAPLRQLRGRCDRGSRRRRDAGARVRVRCDHAGRESGRSGLARCRSSASAFRRSSANRMSRSRCHLYPRSRCRFCRTFRSSVRRFSINRASSTNRGWQPRASSGSSTTAAPAWCSGRSASRPLPRMRLACR
jgi:simple sugar transport system permease protein